MLRRIAGLIALSFVTTPTPAMARSMVRIDVEVVKKLPRDLGAIRRIPEPGQLAWSKRSGPLKPWLSGSPIAVSADDRTVVVADKDNDSVVVIDAKTGAHRHVVKVGKRPERLVLSTAGLAYVANRLGRSVSVVDTKSGTLVATLDGGVEPFDLALSGDQKQLFVNASATAELLIYDVATRKLRSKVRLPTEWPAKVVSHPTRDEVYVTHMRGGQVDVVDVRRGRVLTSMSLPKVITGPHRLRRAFTLGRLIKTTTTRAPVQAMAATISPDGRRLYVSYLQVNVGEPQPFGGSGYGGGEPRPILTGLVTFDTQTRAPLERTIHKSQWWRDPRRESEVAQQTERVSGLFSPAALVHHPTRAGVFMAASGSASVVLADTSAKDPLDNLLAGTSTRALPNGLALSNDGGTLYILQSGAFSVGKVNVNTWIRRSARRAKGKRQVTDATAFNLGQITPVGSYGRDPLPAKARRGRTLFHTLNPTVGGNRFTCVSCHPSGRTDGVTWNIGAGPRQTPILAGQLTGTAPFNWRGTEKTLVNNVKNTVKRLGGRGLSARDAAALAEYVERHLPGIDNPHVLSANTELVAQGEALFKSKDVGCGGCHDTKTAFTDGELHDLATATSKELASAQVGRRKSLGPLTGIAFNTPTLKNVWASAPYLHDGSVPTLTALLTTANPKDRMGHTSHLSSKQVRALEAYLKTL